MQTILAVDDEFSVRKSYELVLGDAYRLLLAEDVAKAFAVLEQQHVDLILLDLILPGMTGLEFLAQLQERGELTPVIVVTGSNTVQTAVEVMKRGARDFVVKPFDVEDLLRLVDRVLRERREQLELYALRERDAAGFEQIIGDAPALREALAKARQAMQVDSTVLITGESGTGKDLLARAIHCGGRRAAGPFVPISCCAIPEQLVESELFGHMKGAFTGATETRVGKLEVADGGTLFLDEIGEMPLDAQAKLLRVLQDGAFYPVGATKTIHVDLRVVCATNRDLWRTVREGGFREDLFYRVNVLPIEMPPLRKRREDIPRLVAHFVAKHAPHVNARCESVAPKALAHLAAY
ncbi:MAG TPA: sigma-54 dependent transcriptional regulator, partial [Candidatus Hydrogenedentes bacterium]|nr:sigma-54 dependent transcriptional regulator [Candidatus Hydrogenedentota bacterium]